MRSRSERRELGSEEQEEEEEDLLVDAPSICKCIYNLSTNYVYGVYRREWIVRLLQHRSVGSVGMLRMYARSHLLKMIQRKVSGERGVENLILKSISLSP